MKNYLLLSAALFLLVTAGFAQEKVTEFPFTEDFENPTFPPAGWSKFKLGGDETWNRNTDFYHGGGASAGHTAFSPGWLEGWLVTPQIEIPNSGNFVLEFWSFNNWPQYHYYAGVWISLTGANPATSTYIEIKQLEGEEVSDTWKKIAISLSNYAGQAIYIGFKYQGDYADCWYIDDISVHQSSNLIDAELFAIHTPAEGTHTNLTDNEPVKIVIKNNGSESITGFEMILKLDNIVKSTETFTGTIPSLGQANFTFTSTLDLSTQKTYQITAIVNLQGDEVPENNSKTITVVNFICNPITTFPFIESFEDEVFPPACWSLYHTGSSKKWERTTDEKRTGEASATCGIASGLESWLVTPALKITNSEDFILEFWSYHLFGELNFHNGIWLSTTGSDPLTSSFTEIKKLSGSELENNVWKKITVPLSGYAGETVYLAFKYEGDVADFWYIDDVLVYDFNEYVDGEIVSIITPISGENLTVNEKVKVLIRNNGNNPITNFKLKLERNGEEIATETYSNSIASQTQAEYTFNVGLNLSALGTHEIKVTIDLSGDQLTNNDFKIKKVAHFSSQATELFGYRIYDTDHSSPPYGFISFYSNNPTEITRINDYIPASPANSMHAGEYVNGSFYAYTIADASPVSFVKISTDTWTDISTAPVTSNPIDMAYDHTANVMYGAELTPDGSNLVTINIENGEMTKIGAMGRDVFTLACSPAGQLFVIDRAGNFCSVNKSTGVSTVIGATGIWLYYVQTMAFDKNTGRLFWAMSNNKGEGKLMEIDPTSGVIFDRGTIANDAQIIGLYAGKTVGIDTYNKNEVTIYPNPTAGTFTILVKESSNISILDITGKLLNSFRIDGKSTINLSYPAGIYLIRVEAASGVSTHKLVISK
jgi:hypothetical protein